MRAQSTARRCKCSTRGNAMSHERSNGLRASPYACTMRPTFGYVLAPLLQQGHYKPCQCHITLSIFAKRANIGRLSHCDPVHPCTRIKSSL